MKGHKIKWYMGAKKLVDKLSESSVYIGGLEGGSGAVRNDVELILNELNLKICDFAITQFHELFYGIYSNSPLVGESAYQFDKQFIEYEQGTIAPPIYDKTDLSTINIFQEMADKDGYFGTHGFGAWLFSDVTPAFDDFEISAKVTDSQFRIDLPLLMLYLDRHKPTWYGFDGHKKTDGTLKDDYKSIIRPYEVK